MRGKREGRIGDAHILQPSSVETLEHERVGIKVHILLTLGENGSQVRSTRDWALLSVHALTYSRTQLIEVFCVTGCLF